MNGDGAPPIGAQAQAPTAPAAPPAAKRWAADVAPPGGSKALPATGEGALRHPFATVARAEYLAKLKPFGSIAKRTHDAPIALVNLHELTGIQETINAERLDQHRTDPKMIPPGTRAAGHGMLIDRPVVVRVGGQLFIHDGHHRLTAAVLRGATSAKVRFVDLDAEGATR